MEKSFEIQDLATKFATQVARNDVHSPAGRGDGYAIDSNVRDYAIGTISAPTTLSLEVESLAQDLEESCMPEELSVIIANLEKARDSLTEAYNLVDTARGKDLGGHRHFVEKNIRESLPSIARTIDKISTLNTVQMK
jgi:hypothetical protein